MAVIQDIKATIERDTDASSETETKKLNITNDTKSTTDESFETNKSMEGMNDINTNKAMTNKEEQIEMEIETVTEKMNDKSEKRNRENE